MVTFRQVMDTDLSKLTDAAQAWDDMADKIEKLETTYQTKVQKISSGLSWTGISANSAFNLAVQTRHEFDAAQVEARAVADLLRDAHGQFVRLVAAVKDAVKEAEKAGMKVDGDGRCTYDYSKVTEQEAFSLRHDPDLPETERSWTRRIEQAVKAVDDADYGVKLALRESVKDTDGKGDPKGFNGAAQGDVEVYEGRRATELGEKLVDGKLSPAELKEMQILMRNNADSKPFTQTFLGGLGPEEAIRLGDKLTRLSYNRDGSVNTEYLSVEQGLAHSVATATTVPGSISERPPGSPEFNAWLNSPDGRFYREWTEGVRKVGTKNFGSGTEPRYGYQAYVSMLDNYDKFDDQYLYSLGDDIIKAEKKEKGSLWTQWGFGGFGFRNDPLDAVLGLMGKNPDAATAFLDPGGKGPLKNDHLAYLLEDRDWPQLANVGYATTSVHDDPLGKMGLGAALEAAATGYAPGTDHPLGQHTEAQARVLHQAVASLNNAGGAEKLDFALRRPMANILMDYTPDVHQTLARDNTVYRAHDGVWVDNGVTKVSIPEDQLVKIMRGIANDPEAYADMYNAEAHYVADTFSSMPEKVSENTRVPIQEASSALGMYDGVRADVLFDDRDKKIQWERDFNNRLTGVTSLAPKFVPKTYVLPVEIAYRIIRTESHDLMWERIKEAGMEASLENAKQFTAGQKEVDSMVASWARTHGHAEDSNYTKDLIGIGQTKHAEGRNQALIHLRADY
ncbi:DUF6571 family protein [Streptomyces cuspidosporus]|uniref:WXG100 family type VII secretion target n=1 Tax=Streptomyces cuspidosporus TaxID=66882 RepID=A0ABN3GET3_9ACTN